MAATRDKRSDQEYIDNSDEAAERRAHKAAFEARVRAVAEKVVGDKCDANEAASEPPGVLHDNPTTPSERIHNSALRVTNAQEIERKYREWSAARSVPSDQASV